MNKVSLCRKKLHPYKWFIWLIAVGFYFYEYVLRVSPSILVPRLIQTFQVNAETVGVISAFYFYAYAPMQLPVGMLTDRFGARRLLMIASIVCGIGGGMFSLAHTVYVAEIGRFLLGTGSAFAYIGLIYVTTHWFEKKRWALLLGIGNSLGMMGAVVGEGPMSFAVSEWGFRSVMFTVSLIAFLIALLVLVIVRNQPKEFKQDENESRSSFKLSLKIVFRSKRAWVVALVSMGYYLAVVTFGALWGVPFLQVSNGFSQEVASFASSMIFFGFVVGGPMIGHLADKLQRKKEIFIAFLALTLISISALIYLSPLPEGVTFMLVFVVGFCCSGQLLAFPLAIQAASEYVKGTLSAFINGMAFFGGAIMQPVIGAILDARAKGAAYSLADYQWAFSTLVVILAFCFIGSFFIADPKKKLALSQVKHDEAQIKAQMKKAA